jgi:hypothetical protein
VDRAELGQKTQVVGDHPDRRDEAAVEGQYVD